MTQRFHLTPKSSNAKTGPIPVSTSPESTCPSSCPLKGKGCYADGGPLRLHWNKVNEGVRGMTYPLFLDLIKAIEPGKLWRHNQCGDLVGKNERIDVEALARLVWANKGKRGFTYTHYPVSASRDNDFAATNAQAIKHANENGFTINLSTDSLEEADQKLTLRIGPVTTLLPSSTVKPVKTPAGNTVIPCPVAIDKLESCAKCGLCQKADRKFIIGFPVHGVRKNALDRFLIE